VKKVKRLVKVTISSDSVVIATRGFKRKIAFKRPERITKDNVPLVAEHILKVVRAASEWLDGVQVRKVVEEVVRELIRPTGEKKTMEFLVEKTVFEPIKLEGEGS